jgi:hypothetical protein
MGSRFGRVVRQIHELELPRCYVEILAALRAT